MNAIRCPNCSSVNQLSAAQCQQCQMPFAHLPQTAYVSVPVEQTFEAQTLGYHQPTFLDPGFDTELGRRTFTWYRVYCLVAAVLNVLVIGLGVFMAYYAPATRDSSSEQNFIIGIMYIVFGIIFFLVYAVAAFLPPKPFNWIVGIVMMALGMTSCCFLPFLIPLLIYWVKPETKAFFGRN